MRRLVIVSVLVASLMILGVSIQVQAAAPKTVSITGEIIDTYCYSLMGARGESHRQCAIDCVKADIPAGLLQDKTNKVYVLLPNKDKTGLPPEVIEKMAQKVTVNGKVYSKGGSRFLTIESIK